MKSKHFSKLRLKVQWYNVDISSLLFGNFEESVTKQTVLARGYQNAAERYAKRHYLSNNNISETAECWAYYRVKLASAINHRRYFKFFN